MRLIDADALLKVLNNLEPRCVNKYVKQGLDDALHYYMPQILEEQPTIDAVPVVRCKDCKHFLEKGGILEPWCDWHEARLFGGDGFCSDGERRGDER